MVEKNITVHAPPTFKSLVKPFWDDDAGISYSFKA